MKNRPYIHIEEALSKRQEGKMSFRLLGEEQGCMAGCCSGITINVNTEYRGVSSHEDQEGFFILEGEGYAILGEEEFEIFPGTSFVALPGVLHGIRTKDANKPVKVLWFHSAI